MKRTLLGTLLVLGFALAAAAQASDDTTITGTLVARNPDSIVVRTVEGERTFAVNDVTSISGDLPLDSQVTVTYRDTGGMAIASQVLPAIERVSAASAPVTAEAGTDASASSGATAPGTRTMTGPAPAATPSHDSLPAETTSAASVPAPPAPAAEALPSTASELPLLALVGVVLLTASLLLRWAR